MKILPALLIAISLNFSSRAIAEEPKQPAVAKVSWKMDVTPEAAELLIMGKPGVVEPKPGLLVIDVRTPGEFAEGHIPGARNVDFLGDDFEKQIAALPAGRPLLVHCASGNRSSKAVEKIAVLHESAQILHLKSGFNGWKAAGKPVEISVAKK